MEKIRLQKYFTDCGVMSRRAAEEEIAAGNVKVNGEVAVIGQKITPFTDRVEYKGKVIKPRRGTNYKYVMLNKPRGFVTTLSDEKGRKCVSELVSDVGSRIYPIGRLDYNSEGLLLFTDDGELANMLTHPRHEIPKYYQVRVGGEIKKDKLKELEQVNEIDGYKILPVRCEIVYTSQTSSIIEMELYEGRNRQIRKMCEAVGLEVLRLKRVAVGELELGDLATGKWRYLNKDEVDYLKDPKAKKAGKK